jgi:PAS domain S-box-containing protein
MLYIWLSISTLAALVAGAALWHTHRQLRGMRLRYRQNYSSRQEAERSLTDREQVLSLIYQNSAELLGVVRVLGQGQYAIELLSQAYTASLAQYGISVEAAAVKGMPLDEFCRNILHHAEEALPAIKARYAQVIARQQPLQYEAESALRNGQRLVLEILLVPLLDAQGQCTHILDFTRDITPRKQAEASLQKANKMLSTLISNLPGVVFRCRADAQWTVEYLSAGFKEMTGYPPELFYPEQGERVWGELVHAEDRERIVTAIQEAFAQRMPYQITYRIVQAGGRTRWIWEQGREVYGEQAEVMWREGFMLDITDLKRTQERLLNAMKDRNRFVRQHNKMLEQQVRERTEALAEANQALRGKNEALRQSEQYLTQALDKLKQAQAQLVTSEKMATLGMITAGLAHEINNPINYIQSGVEGLQGLLQELQALLQAYRKGPGGQEEAQRLEAEAPYEELAAGVQELLQSIGKGARRTAAIVRELRSFSRLDEASRKAADLHQSLEATLAMLQHFMRPDLRIERHYDAGMPLVECYPAKLNQVFMNLIINALQAMQGMPGTLRLSTRYVPADAYEGQGWAHIAISDTGPGIPEAIRGQIFEPFFSSKPVGEGTGLGLSIGLSIIQEHRGRLTLLETAPGRGATFEIALPIGPK